MMCVKRSEEQTGTPTTLIGETMNSGQLEELGDAIGNVANAITPLGVIPNEDAAGGTVCSLTEAVMGVCAGLYAIAHAIDRHTEQLEDCPRTESPLHVTATRVQTDE